MRVRQSSAREEKKLEKPLDVGKLEAEIAKLIAETLKLKTEARWMPLFWVSTLLGVCFAIVKLLLWRAKRHRIRFRPSTCINKNV